MNESIAFDRAAEYYDRSRAISDEAMAATVELLSAEVGGRGRVLEVGVGTGLLALPLHRAGLDLVGIDLALPMLAKLAEKAGGAPPFPLVQADATRMPFADDRFGGAYLRWVLHLITGWRDALAEVVRVLRPGGRFLASLGTYDPVREEIQERFSMIAGIEVAPAGLDWGAYDELDQAMGELGARARALPPIEETWTSSIEEFLEAIEENRHSWTWRASEDARRLAIAELRPWAERRFGGLAEPRTVRFELTWRAYDIA
ncbi:MAG TPA: class I SAM-dependent methyltransferase [Actinomycetota bacterium]|jgi:SAM-dependent methyltransferase|nr:class I SAM-dependent methyltransferase [Actinomycetota bacterium]